jgi:hypothetical protein
MYLKHSIHIGLKITKSKSLLVSGFSDADWAGSLDDKRYAIFLGKNLASWSARKHYIMSKSSTEVEYNAVANATCQRKSFEEAPVN